MNEDQKSDATTPMTPMSGVDPTTARVELTSAEIDLVGWHFTVRRQQRTGEFWDLSIPGLAINPREVSFSIPGFPTYQVAVDATFRLLPHLENLRLAEGEVSIAQKTLQTFALGLIEEARR